MRKIKRTLLSFALVLFLIPPVYALADSVDAQKVLNQYQFEPHSIQGDVGRQIGWGVVTGLHWLVKGIEEVVYSINSSIGDFFRSADVTNLQQNKMGPLTIALLTLVILFIGIMSMIKPRNFSTIAGNLVVGIVIFVGIPSFLSGAYDLTTQAITFLSSDSDGVTALMSDRILVDNVTDNTMYDTSGFKSLSYKNTYAVRGGDITQIVKIDPTETIDPGKMKYPDVWKNKLTNDSSGNQTLTALWDGKVGFISIPNMCQYYYRWDIDWFTIISTLIITAVALILSSIKIARLLYELAINQTLTQFVALFDIMTAQRVRKCLQMLLSTLITLFSVFFMLQMYIIGMAFISKVSNVFLRLILMIALAWATIDGPDLFERIFGIDAGVHNATRALLGMQAAGNMAAGGIALLGGRGVMDSLRTKGILGTAGAAAGKIGSVAGGAGGIAAGLGKGMLDNHSRYTAARKGQANSNSAGSAASGTASTAEEIGLGGQVGNNSDMSDRMEDSEMNQVQEATANMGDDQTVESSQESGITGAASFAQANDVPLQSDSGNPDISEGESRNAQSSGKKSEETISAQTIGGYVGGRIANGFNHSGAARSARRMYNLTYGSSIAHGDRQVARIERHQRDSGVNRDSHQSSQSIKPKEDKSAGSTGERTQIHREEPWGEQEYELEKRKIEETGPEEK